MSSPISVLSGLEIRFKTFGEAYSLTFEMRMETRVGVKRLHSTGMVRTPSKK